MSPESKPQLSEESTPANTAPDGAPASILPETTSASERLRADKPAQALHSQWAQEDANRTARQREEDKELWRDVK